MNLSNKLRDEVNYKYRSWTLNVKLVFKLGVSFTNKLNRVYLKRFLSDISPFVLIVIIKTITICKWLLRITEGHEWLFFWGSSFPPASCIVLVLFKFTSFSHTWTSGLAQRLTDVAPGSFNGRQFVILQMVWLTILVVWWSLWWYPYVALSFWTWQLQIIYSVLQQ